MKNLRRILGTGRDWVRYVAADGQERAYHLDPSIPDQAETFCSQARQAAVGSGVEFEAISGVGIVVDGPLSELNAAGVIAAGNLREDISKGAAISAAILSSTSLWLPPEGEVSDTSIHTAWFAGSQAEALLKYADEAKKTGTQSSLQVQAVVERPRYILEGAIQPNDSVFVQASLSWENLQQLKIPVNVIQGALLAPQLHTELQR